MERATLWHDSDCAIYSAPAYEPGRCNCDFEKRKNLYIEAHQRAVFAHLAMMFERMINKADPIIGFVGGLVSYSGVCQTSRSGAIRATDFGALVEMIRFDIYKNDLARLDLLTKNDYRTAGLGDQYNPGTGTIECPCEHEGEADREKREWAGRLSLTSLKGTLNFYGPDLPVPIKRRLEAVKEELEEFIAQQRALASVEDHSSPIPS